jgi:single-stranded DNA-binding protein
MNRISISATLTRDPELKPGSCILKLSYAKHSGKKCYITAVANGRMAKTLSALKKGDTVWLEGRLSGFSSDKWKSYIEIEHVEFAPAQRTENEKIN